MNFWTMGLKSSGLKRLWLKSPGLKCPLSYYWEDISTPDFSTPWFKNSWLKSPGLKLGVEKSGVEMSFNNRPLFTTSDCWPKLFRIQFYVVQSDVLHQKLYCQPFLAQYSRLSNLSEQLEVPNPDKMPKLIVKTGTLPQKFLVYSLLIISILKKSLLFNILSKNLTDYSTQQYWVA